jgi:AraC-like DNA-binding protein
VHISVSTLERWFAENLRMTPSVYIKKIRLANAARFLSNGDSVTETAERCGFSDVSAMISLFKQQYGMTPLQYKKKTKKGETV